ncbi:hypothetical protein KGY64_01430 [Candidatus Bipolaricaulota bacterium]|nr:hypothetical protein [Candidatus Bipolaricaulota bacterium]
MITRKSLYMFLLVFGLAMLTTGFSVAGDSSCCLTMRPGYCPSRYDSFVASKDIYHHGEPVVLTLNDLQDEYLIEEITIEEVGIEGEVVFHEVVDETVSKEATTWTYEWDQVGNDGETVDYDHYYAIVETQCCQNYRTHFRIQKDVKKWTCCTNYCCGRSTSRLFSHSDKYLVGDTVHFAFANPQGGNFIFDTLKIVRKNGCCGYDTVFSYTFPEGAQPGKSWNWNWNQADNWGNSVGPGYYTLIINTERCSSFSTNFRVYEQRTPTCRPFGWFFGCCDC